MRIFHPLRNPPVAWLWGGLSLSALGDQLYAVALAWIAVGVFGPFAGYLSALNNAVVLLAVIGIGRWADAWEARRSMVASDLMRAAILLLVVVAWLLMGRPHAAGLIAAVVVLALGQAVFRPAMQSVLPAIVGDRTSLPAANGLLDATDRSARLLGPGLVAGIAGFVPVVHFLTIDAVTFIGSALAVTAIARHRPLPPAPARRDRPARQPVLASIARGIRAMRSHPILGYILATTGPLNGAWFATYYLCVPLLVEQRGLVGPGGSGLGAFGLVISAYGLTNLGATLVLGGRPMPARPQFQMFAGNMMTGGGMVLLGLAGLLPEAAVLPALALAAAIGAVGGPMQDIPTAVLRQTRLHQPDMASAMRAYMAMTNAGTLLALLAIPLIITAAGVLPVIIGCGLLVVGCGVVGLVRLAGWTEAPG